MSWLAMCLHRTNSQMCCEKKCADSKTQMNRSTKLNWRPSYLVSPYCILLVSSLTQPTSRPRDALLAPVLVRHPGNAFGNSPKAAKRSAMPTYMHTITAHIQPTRSAYIFTHPWLSPLNPFVIATNCSAETCSSRGFDTLVKFVHEAGSPVQLTKQYIAILYICLQLHKK